MFSPSEKRIFENSLGDIHNFLSKNHDYAYYHERFSGFLSRPRTRPFGSRFLLAVDQKGQEIVYAESLLVYSKVIPFLPLTLTKVPIPFVRGLFIYSRTKPPSLVKSSCARTLRYQVAGKLKSFCDSCRSLKPRIYSPYQRLSASAAL